MQAGKVFEERFELSHVLGSGGFGDVWAAKDRQTGGAVAIKVIPCAANARAWQRGLVAAETAALARLQHPHIVTLHESIVTDERIIMVMEQLSGSTLASEVGTRATQGRHYSPAEAAQLLAYLVDAIDAAHQSGVLHRDLKPGNVMVLDDAPHLKLLDFGIARLADQLRSEATTAGRMLGTFTQLAPEVIRGEEVDARVDVFGLGCLMFEVLTLRHPWIVTAAGHAQRGPAGGMRTPKVWNETFERILRGARPTVSPYNPAYGRAVDAVIHRALASRPDERYDSVRALQLALHAAMQERVSVPGLEVTPVALRPLAIAADLAVPPPSQTEPDPVVPHAAFGRSDQVELASDAFMVRALDPPEGMRTELDLIVSDAPVDAAEPDWAVDVIEVAPTQLPPDGDAVLRARAALAPPRAPSMADLQLQPSVAVAIRLKPAWVKFSALSDRGAAYSASAEAAMTPPDSPVPPPQPAPLALYGWLAMALGVLAVLTGVTQGVLQGAGLGLGALAAAAAHASAWRLQSGHRATRKLMAALQADDRFRWAQSAPSAVGLSLRGDVVDAPADGRVTVFLPTAPFLAGGYRVGFTLRLRNGVGSERRMSVTQITQAMKDPDMAARNELMFPLLYHLKRRQPSAVELSGRDVRFSVVVSRSGIEDAVDDISTSMLAATVVLQWMDRCLEFGEASGDPR